MTRKVTVTNIATRDSVFSVVGTRDIIAEYIMYSDIEWLTFTIIHATTNELTQCNVLNRPREIVMIGTEHEVDLDEGKEKQSAANVGRVSLG